MESMASASLSSLSASNDPPSNGVFVVGVVVGGIDVDPSSPDDNDDPTDDIIRTVPRKWRRHSRRRCEGNGIIDGVRYADNVGWIQASSRAQRRYVDWPMAGNGPGAGSVRFGFWSSPRCLLAMLAE